MSLPKFRLKIYSVWFEHDVCPLGRPMSPGTVTTHCPSSVPDAFSFQFSNLPCPIMHWGSSAFQNASPKSITNFSYKKMNLLGLHNMINMIPAWDRALIYLLIFCITSWNMNIIKAKTLFCLCISNAQLSPAVQ